MKPRPLTWDRLDWSVLDRMRDTFLGGTPPGASYWTSPSDLENYNFTFAQRIGWKWDAVLRELQLRGWTPPTDQLLDWGCGSGIASRRVIDVFGPDRFKSLCVFDRSPLAMEFAAEQAQAAFPSMRVEACPGTVPRLRDDDLPPDPRKTERESPVGDFIAPRRTETMLTARESERRTPVRRESSASPGQERAELESGAPRVGTLVISHVLNELTEAGRRALHQVIDGADAVLWVEPGTYADSRALISVREHLGDAFLLIAPCTHQAACGLLAPANERHWCHHFASSPPGIMADSNWVRFAQRAGIDLRSLPYSFLVLERKGLRNPVPGLLSEGCSHIIGEPRFYKGFAKVFSCQEDGVRDLTLQKRDAPDLFKAMRTGEADPVWRWHVTNGLIGAATPVGARSAL